jgi:ATP-dependent Lon protease
MEILAELNSLNYSMDVPVDLSRVLFVCTGKHPCVF